ncbi:MAG: TIGR03936 family radical SAM-associated protein [Bacillota bacterium]
MILRLSKEEPVRFISHLDMQGMLQRALRRTGLPVAYTKGFHPHAQVSFALALGVGFTSAGEYADIQLLEEAGEVECAQRLAQTLPAGFGVCAVCVVEGGPALSTLMQASDYCITANDTQALTEGMQALLDKDAIVVQKRGKGGVKDLDIRPMVISAKQEESGIMVRLWASAEGTLSPSLLMRALWESVGSPADTPFAARRIDLLDSRGRSLFDCVCGT